MPLHFCQKPTLLLNANYAYIFHLLYTIMSTLTAEENRQVYCLHLTGEDGERFCPHWTAGGEKLERRNRSTDVVELWASVICHSHSATIKQKIFLFVLLTK